MEKAAQFLTGRTIYSILHSGKTRAAQTAEILNSNVLSKHGIMKKEGLAPNDPVDNWVEKLNADSEDLMIVGHLPFLSKLAGRLLGGKEKQELIAFQHAGIVCLERIEYFHWKIAWMVIPELVNCP